MEPQEDPQRSAILDAAAELFEQYSYRKTTVEEIAQKAGIGKGSVYLHYESKEAIGLAWLHRIHDTMFSTLADAARGPGAPLARLKRILVLRVMLRDAVFRRHRRSLDEALESLRGTLDAHRERFHRREASLIADLIEEALADGSARPADEPPAKLGETLVLATNALLPYRVRTEQVPGKKTIEHRARRVAALLVRALSHPTERPHV